MKTVDRWFSDRVQQELTVARWGHFGVPVLVFPTAGGDAEEIERHKLVDACAGLIDAGRVKIYSFDSVAGRAMATNTGSPEYRMWLLNQFHHAVRQEVVPAIHADTGGDQRIVTAGASIGAFNAVALLCRFPDVFEAALGMSGTYRIQRFLDGAWSDDLFYSSPVDFVPGLDGDHLELLQQRRVILASGEGEHEDIGESWVWRTCSAARACPTASTPGARRPSTTGPPGGGCSRSTSTSSVPDSHPRVVSTSSTSGAHGRRPPKALPQVSARRTPTASLPQLSARDRRRPQPPAVELVETRSGQRAVWFRQAQPAVPTAGAHRKPSHT